MYLGPGIYRHYGGDEVEVFQTCYNTETKQDLVIYEHNDKLLCMSIGKFNSKITHEGKRQRRFSKII